MKDTLTITVYYREVYGVGKYYPVCDRAHLFAQIARTKTLTGETLEAVRRLGYTIRVEHRLRNGIAHISAMEPIPENLFTGRALP